MKLLRAAAIRVGFCLLIGLLLLCCDEATTWLVRACGLVFVVGGGVALVGYFAGKKEQRVAMALPAGAGSLLFGLLLLICPTWFDGILVLILAVVLFLIGLVQEYLLVELRKKGVKAMGMTVALILPVLSVLSALWVALSRFILSEGEEAAPVAHVSLLGWGYLAAAVAGLWAALANRCRKAQPEETGDGSVEESSTEVPGDAGSDTSAADPSDTTSAPSEDSE